MSFENELNELYPKIAEKINEMIPAEWEEFYFNGEVKDGEGGVYFFYTTLDEKQEYKYSHYIPRMYNVDRKIYNQLLHELFDLTVQLQQVFIDNQQGAWFSVTMIGNGEGKLKVRFNYVNWNDSEFGPSDRIEYFEYKYLKRELTDENDKELMERMQKYEEEYS
ncbi:immunity protein YezG family protein [Bacillus sp. H1a]|uniref:immunity protein YezG family protein n=1 Tax=Bacillus sp. H1a TaxID=1397276 RepID=UPI0004691D97|nr:immunity protein YezG family protein [Bacillus sp. H1a]